MTNTLAGMSRLHALDRSEVTTALKYALKPELLAFYVVVYVGLALSDWNVLSLFYGVLYLAPAPFTRLLVELFGFVTSLIGYVIAAAGVVGVLKTVLEDSLARSNPTHERADHDA